VGAASRVTNSRLELHNLVALVQINKHSRLQARLVHSYKSSHTSAFMIVIPLTLRVGELYRPFACFRAKSVTTPTLIQPQQADSQERALRASSTKRSCTNNTEDTTDRSACDSWPGTRASFGSHGETRSKDQASNADSSQPYLDAKDMSCSSVVPTGIASSLPCADPHKHARLAPASIRRFVWATKASRQHEHAAFVYNIGQSL
jgi:hypothetical protein